jgi:serine/threonine protein kinase
MDVLGKGGFALVWLADNKENNIKYAVKQISR